MKLFKFTPVLALALILSSCSLYSPTYFGSKHEPTTDVKSFYAASDVKQPYEVIGHMNILTGRSESIQNRTRKAAIEKTKEIGGDGIIFLEVNRQVNQNTTDDYTLKADVIKFK